MAKPKKKPAKKAAAKNEAAARASSKTYDAVRQGWLLADSWSGPEDLPPTLHLTSEDRDAYVSGFYRVHNNQVAAPEVYTRTSGEPQLVVISAALRRKLQAQKIKVRMRVSRKVDGVHSYEQFGIEVPTGTHLA